MATSQSRNSAFRRPSPCRVMRPVTSACALMVFQFSNCGAASMLVIRLDEGGLIDRREQSAALEIVGDDLRHADADLAIRRRSRHEIRNRDRQRREVALGNDARVSGPKRIADATAGKRRRAQPCRK